MSRKRFGLGRAIATGAIATGAIALVVPLTILGIYALGGATPGDREKRIRELEATQARLYEMLAATEARIEAQRRMYASRFRKTEALLLEREQELVILKSRSRAIAETPSDPIDRQRALSEAASSRPPRP